MSRKYSLSGSSDDFSHVSTDVHWKIGPVTEIITFPSQSSPWISALQENNISFTTPTLTLNGKCFELIGTLED